ncbi:MAG: EthD family reductase [Nitriliruptoraceae bacterium]
MRTIGPAPAIKHLTACSGACAPETPAPGRSQVVKLIALLKASPGMSRKEFERRWVDEHAPLTLRFPNLKGYRINVAIAEYQEIEGELPYDGTAEMWWDSLEEMQEDFDSQAAQVAVADADEFTVVRTHIFTRETIVLDPGA